MNISAKITSEHQKQQITVQTNGNEKKITLPLKDSGYGSAVNGGELLLLAIALCYSNDIYREAAKMNIPVSGVEVLSNGEFGAEGEPGQNFRYNVKIVSSASAEDVEKLILATDKVAEIHNTLRKGLDVTLTA